MKSEPKTAFAETVIEEAASAALVDVVSMEWQLKREAFCVTLAAPCGHRDIVSGCTAFTFDELCFAEDRLRKLVVARMRIVIHDMWLEATCGQRKAAINRKYFKRVATVPGGKG